MRSNSAVDIGNPVLTSADRKTSIEVRQVSHPAAVRRFNTEELRQEFLVQGLFAKDRVTLTYTHIDRFVIGGAMPTKGALALEALKPIGSPNFLDRRELGILNIGGEGTVTVGKKKYPLKFREALYVGRGEGPVSFASAKASKPAKFYLLSTPAHATHPTVKLTYEDANKLRLGAAETANLRTLVQVIHPDVCKSCQLVMGYTMLDPGNVWNTMPSHTHDRRSEVYLYFDMQPDTRIFHMMGEPTETRHLIVAPEEAIISPGWSIHSGVGTANYTFCWAMGGDNVDFTDMDFVAMGDLR